MVLFFVVVLFATVVILSLGSLLFSSHFGYVWGNFGIGRPPFLVFEKFLGQLELPN